jgi:hypothetical protein
MKKKIIKWIDKLFQRMGYVSIKRHRPVIHLEEYKLRQLMLDKIITRTEWRHQFPGTEQFNLDREKYFMKQEIFKALNEYFEWKVSVEPNGDVRIICYLLVTKRKSQPLS